MLLLQEPSHLFQNHHRRLVEGDVPQAGHHGNASFLGIPQTESPAQLGIGRTWKACNVDVGRLAIFWISMENVLGNNFGATAGSACIIPRRHRFTSPVSLPPTWIKYFLRPKKGQGDSLTACASTVRKDTKLGTSRPFLGWPVFVLLDVGLDLLHKLQQLTGCNLACGGHVAKERK